jgi:hypothetical protein
MICNYKYILALLETLLDCVYFDPQFEDSSKMVTESTALTAFSEETHSSRLARKAKEAPFMPIGVYELYDLKRCCVRKGMLRCKC